jgi:hypothetical protein
MRCDCPDRRFPPPWSVQELDACFVVKDSGGQKLAIKDDLRSAAHSPQKAKPTGGAMLDLRRNLAQPFLGAICPSLMMSDGCLEIIYLIVCGLKLIREILSGLSCLLEFSLSRLSRLFNKLKNGTPCPVHYIGFRGGTPFRSIRDNGFQTHRTLTNFKFAPAQLVQVQLANFGQQRD